MTVAMSIRTRRAAIFFFVISILITKFDLLLSLQRKLYKPRIKHSGLSYKYWCCYKSLHKNTIQNYKQGLIITSIPDSLLSPDNRGRSQKKSLLHLGVSRQWADRLR